jgi:hypothetical protein
MRREIVHHHSDQFSVRIVDIGQVTHAKGEVARRAMFSDFHMALGPVHVEEHEQIGCTVAPILAIIPLGLTWRRRDWFAYLSN